MSVSIENSVLDRVIGITKVAQEKGIDPLLWALQIISNLSSNGVVYPLWSLQRCWCLTFVGIIMFPFSGSF